MNFSVRCPACRARQELAWPSEQGADCRRCDADLSLLAAATAKIQEVRRRLREAVSPAEFTRIRRELSLWDPSGRIR